MEYYSRSARIFTALWESNGATNAVLDHPDLPQDYREVFSNCIRHAEPTVGTYLSKILVILQVHDARLREIVNHSGGDQHRVVNRVTLISYLYRLGELQALANQLFDFARGEEDFNATNLSWEDFRNAYGNLHFVIDDIVFGDDMNLRAFTLRRLERD